MAELKATQHNRSTIGFYRIVFPDLSEKKIVATDRLIESGIDSLGMLVLIEYIENTYRIRISNEDVIEENFGTMEAIAEYIIKSRAAV